MTNPMPDWNRRRLLKANLAAAALFLPLPYAQAWAQSDGAIKLLRLPKLALVIGNSNYKNAPQLGNPGNDAKAIGETLRQSGFEVTVKLDATRDDLATAMRAHVQALAARKAVGLFYFAGHGLQLAWRNYLVPVDAAVRRLEDIQSACVDLTSLIDGINKASNPMNVVILDACRENPFGDIRVENRGLSQIDAPHSTLLAYATAPGNVASDGAGANGLYTENLLREMRVQDAKIEDVFKRVRLNVRRRTNGQQIPWESTSLEEDFWFVPPKELKKVSDAEAAREFEAELAIWESIKAATDRAPLEDYLLRYPSGRFAELAQLRLDDVLARQGEKRIEVVSDTKNPFSRGSVRGDKRYKVGDSYTYRRIDNLTRQTESTFTNTIVEITDTEVIYDRGLITNLLGGRLRAPDGRRFTTGQDAPLEFAVGKRWTTRFYVMPPKGGRGTVEINFRIVAREQVTVPAGTFDTFRLEGRGWSSGVGPVPLRIENNIWRAPGQLRRPVIIETHRQRGQKVIESNRDELVAFKQT